MSIHRLLTSGLGRLLLVLVISSSTMAFRPIHVMARSSCSHSGHALGDAFAVNYRCVRAPTRVRPTGHGVRLDHRRESVRNPLLSVAVCKNFQDLTPCGGTEAPCTASVHVENGEFAGGGRAPQECTPRQLAAVAAGPAPLPQVTPAVVLTALRTVGLPSLRARTQPEDKTLVNFATIFYTRPEPFTRTVTLLGRAVRLEARPSSFLWHYGDGSTSRSARPGAPYPAKDITHDYIDAHTTVLTSVDVTYSGRFRVGAGPWQAIPGTVTITGPTSPLRVSEATAVLSGGYN